MEFALALWSNLQGVLAFGAAISLIAMGVLGVAWAMAALHRVQRIQAAEARRRRLIEAVPSDDTGPDAGREGAPAKGQLAGTHSPGPGQEAQPTVRDGARQQAEPGRDGAQREGAAAGAASSAAAPDGGV